LSHGLTLQAVTRRLDTKHLKKPAYILLMDTALLKKSTYLDKDRSLSH